MLLKQQDFNGQSHVLI